jgi:hypothetical protein
MVGGSAGNPTWPTLAAVLAARAIGGIVLMVVFAVVSIGSQTGGYGLVVSRGASTVVYLVFILAGSLLASALLPPFLKTIAGLEISFGGAFVAMLVGSLVGVGIELLFAAQPASGASPAGLTAFSPLFLLVPLVVQFVLVRSLATSSQPHGRWDDDKFWND